jgi:uncharacterized protein (TIGR00730 family)
VTIALRRVCVFCGSSPGRRPEYAGAAAALGQRLASESIGVVYGGGRVGVMGSLAEAALAAGGEVIGVIPRQLVGREIAHTGLTELHVVDSMHARKALMSELSDAFVALPGGLGTLEETFEMLTWTQLGVHEKPVGLLDVAGYFGRLRDFLDHTVAEGFVSAQNRGLVMTETEPSPLLNRLRAFEMPAVPTWVEDVDRA